MLMLVSAKVAFSRALRLSRLHSHALFGYAILKYDELTIFLPFALSAHRVSLCERWLLEKLEGRVAKFVLKAGLEFACDC